MCPAGPAARLAPCVLAHRVEDTNPDGGIPYTFEDNLAQMLGTLVNTRCTHEGRWALLNMCEVVHQLQEREAEVRQLAASLDEEAGAREGEHLRMQCSLHDLERQLRASQVLPQAQRCPCVAPNCCL